MSIRRKIYLPVLFSALFVPYAYPQAAVQLKPGVVIENVVKNSGADRAGMQPRDIVLNWVRADTRGPIESPFDLADVEIEQGPRGNVTLEGLRGTEPRSWTMGPDVWGIKARPNLQGKLLEIYQEGQQLSEADKFTEAAMHWREAAADQVGWLGPWFYLHASEALAHEEKYKDADDAYREAIQMASESRSPVVAQLLRTWADSFQKRNDWDNAEKYYQQALLEKTKSGNENLIVALNLYNLGLIAYKRGNLAKAEENFRQTLEIRQRLAPESLDVAASFNNLGRVALSRGDLAKAEEYFRQTLEIRQKLVPESLDVAASLNNLGIVATERGDLTRAEEYQHQSLNIKQKLAPGSMDVAFSLNNLGLVTMYRGDLTKAEEYHRQALEIRQKLAPGSLDVNASLNNLGLVAKERGDFTKAEEYYTQSLVISQRLAPGSLLVAYGFNNLGNLALSRGDLAKAEEFHRLALEIRQKLAPGSLDVASSLGNLGDVVLDRGDLSKAGEYYRQALAVMQVLAPGSLNVASCINNLGLLADAQGEMTQAEKYYRQALAIRQKLAPESLDVASSFNALGRIAGNRGDLAKAEENYGQALMITEKLSFGRDMSDSLQGLCGIAHERHDLARSEQYCRRALTILEKLAPGSNDHAETLAALGSIMRDEQQPDAGAVFFEQALDAFETQTAHLGGSSNVRSEFRAKHADYYRNYIDLLMSQKRPELAFHVAERLRARSLLETLAVAHIDIHTGADPELLERERATQQSLNATRDRRVLLLTGQHSEEQVAAIEKELEAFRTEYEEIESRIQTKSPAYAALTQPKPLTAQEIQLQLDDNTLLLEYSLGKEHSYVWAVTHDSLTAYELPKREEIEGLARRVYRLQSAPGIASQGRSTWEAEYRKQAAALSKMVLGPVAMQLREKRLVVVSDGALQYIPFAALPAPGDLRMPLIVEHEVVNAPSASVLAVLRREASQRKQPPKTVVAIADPVFNKNDVRVGKTREQVVPNTSNPMASLSSAHLARSVGDVGLSRLPRLSFSRREADAILATIPPGMGIELVDFQASRANATGVDLASYRIVHFATHGLLDSAHPELSGLVLSLVDQKGKPQNGFLDLQDIYNLNLPADLVVLSACETALGKDIKGEGLVGLTRGFMYAGATRVLASLWKVDDVATSELMRSFYKSMQQGLPPAAALRHAQIEMRAQKRWARPYYWAGFQLQGEWK